MNGPASDDDPWSVLGLERGVTDPAAIRRAYAQGIRRHRPEDDPEGFRRVRAAYELLLRAREAPWVLPDAGDASDDVTVGELVVPARTPEATPAGEEAVAPRDRAPEEDPPLAAPSEAALLAERWIAAARTPEPTARDAALAEVAGALSRGFGFRPPLAAEVVREVEARAQSEPAAPLLARVLPAKLLLRLFFQGDPMPLLWACWTLLDTDRLVDAQRLLEGAGKALPAVADPALVGALVRLGRLAVVLAPAVARRLVDLAWRTASPAERRGLGDQRIDFLLDVADDVKAWPAAARGHVARAAVLGGLPPEAIDGAVPVLRGAVRTSPEAAAVRWFLHEILPDRFPSPGGSPSGSAPPARRRRRRAARGPRSTSRVGGFHLLWVLLCVGGAIRGGIRLLEGDRPGVRLPDLSAPKFERFREGGLGAEDGEIVRRARIRYLEDRLRRSSLTEEERTGLRAELAALRLVTRSPRAPGPGGPPPPDPEPSVR